MNPARLKESDEDHCAGNSKPDISQSVFEYSLGVSLDPMGITHKKSNADSTGLNILHGNDMANATNTTTCRVSIYKKII